MSCSKDGCSLSSIIKTEIYPEMKYKFQATNMEKNPERFNKIEVK